MALRFRLRATRRENKPRLTNGLRLVASPLTGRRGLDCQESIALPWSTKGPPRCRTAANGEASRDGNRQSRIPLAQARPSRRKPSR